MKLYEVYSHGDAKLFTNQQLAYEYAVKLIEGKMAEEVDITRVEVTWPITKQVFIEIVNSGGGRWCKGRELVQTVKQKKRLSRAATGTS